MDKNLPRARIFVTPEIAAIGGNDYGPLGAKVHAAVVRYSHLTQLSDASVLSEREWYALAEFTETVNTREDFDAALNIAERIRVDTEVFDDWDVDRVAFAERLAAMSDAERLGVVQHAEARRDAEPFDPGYSAEDHWVSDSDS